MTLAAVPAPDPRDSITHLEWLRRNAVRTFGEGSQAVAGIDGWLARAHKRLLAEEDPT